MPNFTVNANEISQPLFVPAGTLVTVTPSAGATVTLDYTLDSGPTVFSGLATWVAWPNGAVTALSSDMLNEPAYIRVRPTGGAASVSYDPSPGWQQKSQFVADWGSYLPGSVRITGGTINGSVLGSNVLGAVRPKKILSIADQNSPTITIGGSATSIVGGRVIAKDDPAFMYYGSTNLALLRHWLDHCGQ